MPRLREFKWNSWAEVAQDVHWFDRPGIIAVDTETTGLEYYDEPFAATLTWRRPDGSLASWYIDLEADGREGRVQRLRAILTHTPAWVFHNAKFDLQKLLLIGAITEADLEQVELHDTQTLYHLLDENSPKGLKDLAVRVLNYDDTIEVEVKSGPNKGRKRRVPKEQHHLNAVRRQLKLKKADGYHWLPREVVVPYALRDTEFTLQLWEKLWPRVQRKGESLVRLYQDSMELQAVLLRMEADGFALDLPYLEETTSEYGARVMEAWQRVVELTGRPDLNPQSPAQLLEAFRARGINLESTDKAALDGLDDDLARAVLEYRAVKKIHTTYLRGLMDAQRNGIVHPSFNADGARTGRMSSGTPKE